jgi:hypothetical protein
LNNKLIKNETLITSEILGLADVFIYPIDKIENFSIRLNNGRYIFVEIFNKDNNMWSVYTLDNTVIINKLDRPPFYY